MNTEKDQEWIWNPLLRWRISRKWREVLANILLLIGEILLIALIAYFSLHLSYEKILKVGIPGLLCSGLLICIGIILDNKISPK